MTTDTSVLVVDDNRVIAETYTAFLEDEYDVTTAYGGRDALEALDPRVDVVLLDRRMPDLTGDEVLTEIDTLALDCRVVMVTAVDPAFDIVDMPFDAYVTKPVGRDELVQVVDEMVERAEYDDEFRKFLSLLSKKATLERERDSSELEHSDEYRQIERQIEQKRSALGVTTEDLEAVFGGTVSDIDAADVTAGSGGG